MTESGEVDYEGFRRLVDFQIAEGIGGLVPLGTTGETPTLDDDEEEKLIKIAVKQTNGRVPLILGTGSNSTRHMVGYTKRAKDLGADAALVVTPYYNKPNDSGILRHFESAGAVGLPIIVYNIAGRTGRNIPTPLLKTIAEIPGIIGVKEASGDIAQMDAVIREIALPRRSAGGFFTVLSGDDGLTLPLLALGGDGVVSVISNLLPRKVAELTKAGLSGDFAECRRLHYALSGLTKAVFAETNPVPIKTAMTWAGLPGGPVRLPLGPLSAQSREILKTALADLGIQLKA
jgi:4-hydroxy-tetrahydrodipicolinate synthase